jgi:hypothetical protein
VAVAVDKALLVALVVAVAQETPELMEMLVVRVRQVMEQQLVLVEAPEMLELLVIQERLAMLVLEPRLVLLEVPEVREPMEIQEPLVTPALELQVAEQETPAQRVQREQTAMLELLDQVQLLETPALVEMRELRAIQVQQVMLVLEEH